MALRKLKKRSYLGEGYLHKFVNDSTKEAVFVECTKEEYEQLGLRGGSRFNPILPGHTWKFSAGGTTKVDTPNSVLGKDEYCELPDGRKVVYVEGTDGREQVVPGNAIDGEDMLDEDKLTEKIR